MVLERDGGTQPDAPLRKPSSLSARGTRRASTGAPAAGPEATLDAVPFQSFDEAPLLLPPGEQRPREVMQTAISRMRFRSVHDEGRFTRGWLTEHSQRLLCAFTWHRPPMPYLDGFAQR